MNSLNKVLFAEQIAKAYAHLYDLAYLRTHPLLPYLASDDSLPIKERAWEMHHILLDVISELRPESQAETFARQHRRYNLMTLRYIKGLEPAAVADQLLISRRHYYREHNLAIKIITDILWQRYLERSSSETQPAADESIAEVPDQIDIFRMETARLAIAGRHVRINGVMKRITPLLQRMLEQHEVLLDVKTQESFPGAAVDPNLLKQIFLSMFSFLIESARGGRIVGEAWTEDEMIHLRLMVKPETAIQETSNMNGEERIIQLTALGALGDVHIQPRRREDLITGFDILLPIARRTILVIDDNQDILALFERYLRANHYHVVTISEAGKALSLARQIRPYAITLDLMMPEQDGWDILQILRNHPEVESVPIIVCSVLKQKELALSLGATAFLEKPITEQSLLSVLGALEQED